MSLIPYMCNNKEPYVILKHIGLITGQVLAHEIGHTLVTLISSNSTFPLIIILYNIHIAYY